MRAPLSTTKAIFGSLSRSALRLSMLGLEKGPHVTRYYMYRHLRSVCERPIAELSLRSSQRTLSISHSVPLCTALGLDRGQIVEANYPEVDLLSLPFGDNSFHVVVSDQVIEHVGGDPLQAVEESRRVLKPGGLAVHTTCFLNPMHGAPEDYWRFSPKALELLCGRFSDVLDVGGWGNPLVFIAFALRWRYEPVPHLRFHPYHWVATINMKRFPVSTWAVARK